MGGLPRAAGSVVLPPGNAIVAYMKPSIVRSFVLVLLFLAASAGAAATDITFSPAPPVAGQPFTITFHGHAGACEHVGTLEVANITPTRVTLLVTPPGCPIIPTGILEYTASVTMGPLAAGTYEVSVFQDLNGPFVLLETQLIEVKPAPACNATDTALCLGDGRFEVTGEWTDFDGNDGVAHTMPDDFDGLGDWGTLWFFSQENPEMVVKALDGCAVNGHYWVFLSPASTVRYEITVRDVRTGTVKTYSKPLHEVPELFADTSAFDCTP